MEFEEIGWRSERDWAPPPGDDDDTDDDDTGVVAADIGVVEAVEVAGTGRVEGEMT